MKFNLYSLKRKSSLINYALILMTALLLNSSAFGTSIVINVSSFQFTPNNVSANVGDTIHWHWVDGNHTTTSITIPAGAASWDAPMTSGNPMFNYVMTVPGTYNYVCTPHSGSMTGTIVTSSSGGGGLLTENFDYPAGDSLGAHGWNWINSNLNVLSVTAPGLIYSGYPLSNIGNATTVLNTGEDAYKNMTSADSTGAMYVSFMANVTAVQAAGDYFFALLPPTSTTLYTSRFYAKDSSGLRFGVSKSTAAAGGITYTPETYALNTTYLIVIKYQFNPGTTDDAISVFVFTTGLPATEPGVATINNVVGTANDNALGRIALRQGTAANAPTVRVDGFKVGTSWSQIATSVNNISSNVADGFSLSQNYPNPFNPNTTIKFEIPSNGFVNLKVYNALGKEVSNLVNQNLTRGTYSSDFNGSNLNSGVYYYRLTFSGIDNYNFTDTKKLILLK